MRLEPLLRPELTMVLQRTEAPDRDALLKLLAQRVAQSVGGVEPSRLQGVLMSREQQGPTSTPEGVAFPHAMLDEITQTVVAAVRIAGGVAFGKDGHPPCDLIFALVGPAESAWQHVSILARLARVCHRPGALACLRAAKTSEQLFDALKSEDALHG